MATYILDTLRYKEGAFTAAWLTMGAANAAAVFSGLLLKSEAGLALTLLTFVLNAAALFLAGASQPALRWLPTWGGGWRAGRAAPRCLLARHQALRCTGLRNTTHPRPPTPVPAARAGLWASLQFRFVQLQYPGVVIAFEKLLIAGCLPVAAAVQTWGMAAGVGMSNGERRVL